MVCDAAMQVVHARSSLALKVGNIRGVRLRQPLLNQLNNLDKRGFCLGQTPFFV